MSRAATEAGGDGPTALDVPAQLEIQANGGDGPTSLALPRYEGRPGSLEPLIAHYQELRSLKLIEGLPDKDLRAAFMAQGIRWRVLARDELVPDEGSLVLVHTGKVALARFVPEVIDEERGEQRRLIESHEPDLAHKAERKRRERVGPMAERAQQNLAVFEPGDLLERAPPKEQAAELVCYAVTPAVVVTLDRTLVEQWVHAHRFLFDRFRRAIGLARKRLAATDGAQAMVADFFVRHGLAVSHTLRVRKIDGCVNCGACEEACKTRYGVKRLSLNGRILGGLDFVDACHTCSDQRCIDPCNFDAITFDVERREVLIKEDACTGCTLCARACPYDAIEMHDLDANPLLELRLRKEKKLGFGDGTPRKARLRRIASKCDHCSFYPDQACISACPTGALIELAPSDIVPKLPDSVRKAALAGFDESGALKTSEINSPTAFARKVSLARHRSRAKTARTPMPLRLMWTSGLVAVALVLLEVALRHWSPARSLQYWMATQLDGMDPDIAMAGVDYHAGSPLAVQLGWWGTGLLVASLSYVPRKRLRWLQRAGALQAWFDVHVFTSVVGAALIAVHSAARLDNWVSIPFWAMVLTVLSGLAGRYLATRLPKDASLQKAELKHRLAELRATEAGARAGMQWLEAYRQSMPQRRKGVFAEVAGLAWLALDELRRPLRRWSLAWALRRGLPGWRQRRGRRQVAALVRALARAERQELLAEPIQRVLSSWKAVHVPMATILGLLAALHIYLALRPVP